ncbi:MAG: M23 family metallopeptidase [Lachnospiraceae bacterium]|jgi:murein DD-endopeptidase MepM/ murein hydrolase activator NlpD|nr:M23 family metallopeptidase [Lachnospiraceae bacterium]
MKYFKRVVIHVLILTAFLLCISTLTVRIQQTAKIANLLAAEDTKEFLRRQQVPAELYETAAKYGEQSEFSKYEYLAAAILTEQTGQGELEEYLKLLKQYYPGKLQDILKIELAVWEDLKYFPVPLCETDDTLATSFENSWKFARNFGGERQHEGTDIMALVNERGRYPIISMTDGTVEKIGWLRLGGYRIGIRSPSGGYYYYAHLYDYAKDFQEGDEVKAGELLGFMGDSGYGEEGTIGQFAVHLHVGIYVDDENGEEMSLNPYWALKWLESQRLYFRER